jgi:voltage-gated potassium channel
MPDDGVQQSVRAERWIDKRLGTKALRPRNAAYLIATIWLFAVVVFGVFLRIADPDTFDSIWLAFWWAMQTVTTVGYGDVVPEHPSGKALAAVLMLIGLSFLSVITATVTSSFVARRQAELQAAGEDPVLRRLEQISARLDAMQEELQSLRGEPRPPDR